MNAAKEHDTKMNSDVSLSDEESLENPKTVELLERVDLVEKYDKGSDNQEVDDWENPNFDIYKKTDRYGFMHEDEATLDDLNEERAKQAEIKRERKWVKMIRDWEKYKHSIKLRRRIFKGIPEKFRSVVWARLLNVEKNRQKGVYEELRLRARFLSKDLKQIDLDINRTYRNHVFFRRRYDLKQRALFHVLAAYAIYNTQVGYCQGMSQVAALLLMYFDEEDAFWGLHTLMCDESHAMHGFFVPGFPKLLRFQQHHDRVLKKMLPKLKKHLDKCEIHTALYSTKWYFQCFLDRVPFTLALRFWDNFILDGDIILTAAAYCVMKMHEKTLIKLNFEQTMEFLQMRLEESFGYPNDIAVDNLRNCVAELRRSKLLEASTADKSERPSIPFGEILKTPLEDIRRSLSVALSRKRHSRAPSLSQSMPVTPQHRIQTPIKSQQQTVGSLVPPMMYSSAIQFSTTDSSTTPSPVSGGVAVGTGPSASNNFSYNDVHRPMNTSSSPASGASATNATAMSNSGGASVANGGITSSQLLRMVGTGGGGGGDNADNRYHRISPTQYSKPAATVRHAPSFYDNLPLSAAPYANSVEERMEMDVSNNGGARDGSFTYTQTGQFVKTSSQTVVTTYGNNDGPSSNKSKRGAAAMTSSTRHQDNALISSGPNYVTTVEVDPEWRYSYGSSSNASQKSPSPAANQNNFYHNSAGSQSSLLSSPTRKPGKFPIGPDDLWGHNVAGGGDQASSATGGYFASSTTSPTKRSINTFV